MPALIETVLSVLVTEGRDVLSEVAASERSFAARRLLAGRFFLKARKMLPTRARNREDGWSALLEALGVDPATVFRYMRLAEACEGFTEKDRIPSYEELGLDRREGVQPPDAPPPLDDDAPAAMLDQGERKANRDGWCTPAPIASALPKRLDLDPCSNAHSIVIAKTRYMLPEQNGLLLPWFGLTFVNGPYSDLLPFAEKLALEKKGKELKGAGFLVNADNSPEWWHVLKRHLHLRLDFDQRQEFIPPPGVEPSKNDRPQTLLMDAYFWAACNQSKLLAMGTLWEQVAS